MKNMLEYLTEILSHINAKVSSLDSGRIFQKCKENFLHEINEKENLKYMVNTISKKTNLYVTCACVEPKLRVYSKYNCDSDKYISIRIASGGKLLYLLLIIFFQVLHLMKIWMISLSNIKECQKPLVILINSLQKMRQSLYLL